MVYRITIVYNNVSIDENLESGHGFSCFIECPDKKILFDTGDNPKKLRNNLEKLNILPEDLDILVFSHNHHDHIGGMDAILKNNFKGTLCFPNSFPKKFKDRIKNRQIRHFDVIQMEEIIENVYVGPEMFSFFAPKEIPLTLVTEKGLVVITGCAHPGIARMLKKVKSILKKDIYLVLGGFHMEISPILSKVVSDMKELGVVRVAPCHCTGPMGTRLLEMEFKKDFAEVGVGTKFYM